MIMVLGPHKKKAEARAEKAADRAERRSVTIAASVGRRRSSRAGRSRRRARGRDADRRRVPRRAAADAEPGRRRRPTRPARPHQSRTPDAGRARQHAQHDRRTPATDDEENGAMPKKKTHSGAKKRFRVTGSGKVLREQANRRHLLEDKSSRRTRRLAGRRRGRPGRRQEASSACSASEPTSAHRPAHTIQGVLTRGTRQAGSQRPQEAPGHPRAGQRLPRSALAAVPQGQGAGHPLPGLRLPRPQEAQGRLPPAVDPADQRRGPRRTA